MKNFIALSLTLFLVIDALGGIPSYLPLIAKFPVKKRSLYALRELVTALIIMILFHFLGQILFPLLGASPITVKLASGTILFLIAIRLIFDNPDQKPIAWEESESFIVPIATPIIAGPSVLSVIIIMSEQLPSLKVLGAITLAWAFSALIFLYAKPIFHVMKARGLLAAQRLVGLIVTIIAVQIFLKGLKELLG